MRLCGIIGRSDGIIKIIYLKDFLLIFYIERRQVSACVLAPWEHLLGRLLRSLVLSII